MGLAFSIPNPPNLHPSENSFGERTLYQGGKGKIQPSLRNIFKELQNDLGVQRTETDLTDWAEQGVLLLNATLTVRQ